MNYRDKAKQLHENVNHTYDGGVGFAIGIDRLLNI